MPTQPRTLASLGGMERIDDAAIRGEMVYKLRTLLQAEKCAYRSKKTTGLYRTCASPGCPGLAWLHQQKRWKRSE